VVAIFLFAWVTRAAAHDFRSLSSIVQTTITLVGYLFVVIILYGACFITGLGEIHAGSLDSVNLILPFGMSIASTAVGQLLWIWGAGGLGVLFA
jgi:hypothetical protein